MNNKGILRGALTLGVGAIVSKMLGAIYRVPLTNLIGGTGLGLYQMIFPIYSVLLDFAGAGVPNALAKIISADKSCERELNAERVLKSSIKLLFFVGITASIVMLLCSGVIAKLQGNYQAVYGYMFLAPAVVMVSLISCYRGYFQGKMNMFPTALSQVIEQVFKVAFGLLFSQLFMPNVALAVGGATLGITLSEAVSLLYLFLVYKRKNLKTTLYVNIGGTRFKEDAKKLIKYTLPITLIGISIPLSQVIDSFLIINMLSVYTTNATGLYGLMSGTACTIINLPVSICYGLAVTTVPAVSSELDKIKAKIKASKTLVLTFIISLPCAVICYFTAPVTCNLLFSSLSNAELETVVNLIKLLSVNVVFISVLQTQNSVLVALDRTYMPVLTMSIGTIIKTVLNLTLLKNPSLNIYGGAISQIACYFCVVLINFIIIIWTGEKDETRQTANRQLAS